MGKLVAASKVPDYASVMFSGREGSGKSTNMAQCAIALCRALGATRAALFTTEPNAGALRKICADHGIELILWDLGLYDAAKGEVQWQVAQKLGREATAYLQAVAAADTIPVAMIDSVTDIYRLPRLAFMELGKKSKIQLQEYAGIDQHHAQFVESMKWTPVHKLYTTKIKLEEIDGQGSGKVPVPDGKNAEYVARVKFRCQADTDGKTGDTKGVSLRVTDDAAIGSMATVKNPGVDYFTKIMARFTEGATEPEQAPEGSGE